jgi:hypothetical protein
MSECLFAFLDELKAEALRSQPPDAPIHRELGATFERAVTSAHLYGAGALVRLTRERADAVLAAAGIVPLPWCTHTARMALGQCGRMAEELAPSPEGGRASALARARAILHPLARLLHVARIRMPSEKDERDIAVLAHAVLAHADVSLEERLALLREAFGLG